LNFRGGVENVDVIGQGLALDVQHDCGATDDIDR
jgi:hypothetical protein